MGVRILVPEASFVKFSDPSYEHCIFGTVKVNLPVYLAEDIAFQFIIETDTKDEADELSTINNTVVKVGIKNTADTITLFTPKPERFRLDNTHVLYYWTEGLPDFDEQVNVGECFNIIVRAALTGGTTDFTSNDFERINEYQSCFTSVIDYSNDENAFGFDYCAGATVDQDDGVIIGPGGGDNDQVDPQICVPTRIEFENDSVMVIPYTAELLAAYGSVPTVQVWLFDESGRLIYTPGIEAKLLGGVPPTEISIDFGGIATGLVIIKA